MPIARVHNSLNGDEIKQIILAEVDKALSNDSDFRQHKTYNLVAWDWNLKMTAHVTRPIDRALEGKIVAVDPETKVELAQPDDDVLVLEVSTSRSPSAAPDKVRSSAGLPVPMPTAVPKVGVVDVPSNRDRTEKVRSVEMRKDLAGPDPSAKFNQQAQEVVEADR